MQISPPQYLEESRLHYIELLFTQGKGNSRMYVAMRTPSGQMVLPIQSEHLVKQVPLYGKYYYIEMFIFLFIGFYYKVVNPEKTNISLSLLPNILLFIN